jgi:hypothetical protein
MSWKELYNMNWNYSFAIVFGVLVLSFNLKASMKEFDHSFNYGYIEVRNKPSEIAYSRVTISDTQCLDQTGTELICELYTWIFVYGFV